MPSRIEAVLFYNPLQTMMRALLVLLTFSVVVPAFKGNVCLFVFPVVLLDISVVLAPLQFAPMQEVGGPVRLGIALDDSSFDFEGLLSIVVWGSCSTGFAFAIHRPASYSYSISRL